MQFSNELLEWNFESISAAKCYSNGYHSNEISTGVE